jgi:K+-sensing histidine kinase KdpD
LRLQVIIEKFLFIERMREAVGAAEAKSAEAKRLLEQRQEDLMVTMHQLQQPLASMLGSISYLQEKLLQREILRILPWSVAKTVEEQLSSLEDFVTDSTELSYGTFTTFAMEAGRPARFNIHNIDAPKELKRLAERLQKTNARSDLTFKYHAEPGFPILRMDKRVFTSVFSSLIHNAMKYADQHSEVSLICATEGYAEEPVLKVKSVGEPILPSEKDIIFQKFGRGKVVSDGRHNSGVGLGLWVAKQLMGTIKGDNHQKGDLTVELSTRYPRLSVFVVHIPKLKEVTKPAPHAKSGSLRRDKTAVS